MAHFIGGIATLIGGIATRSRNVWRDDSGAVTVDWVVLTAAIIGIAFGAVSQISSATSTLSSKISSGIADEPVGN